MQGTSRYNECGGGGGAANACERAAVRRTAQMNAAKVLRSLGIEVASRTAAAKIARGIVNRDVVTGAVARGANIRVRLTVGSKDMVQTEDRCDRAHSCRADEEVRDERGVVVPRGFLLPAAMVHDGRSFPREYPRSQTVVPVQFVAPRGAGGVRRRVERTIGCDSMFDRLHQVQARLEREFGDGGPVGLGRASETPANVRNEALGRLDARYRGLSDVVNRNERVYAMKSAEEVLAEYRASPRAWKAEEA